MDFNDFSSSIKSELQSHVAAGLVDDMRIYDLMLDALSEFGALPTIRIQTILTVKNGKAKLPDGFKSLYSAIKCEPYALVPEKEVENPDILLDVFSYRVRETTNKVWNVCNPCDVDVTDSCVVEKLYIKDRGNYNAIYNKPMPLKLKMTPYVKKNKCDKDCLNFKENDSPYEISINNKYLYANFNEGNIFLTYNGLDEDEEGFVVLPETNHNALIKYAKAYVVKEFMKQMMLNGDATQVEQNFYQLLTQEAMMYKQQAAGELKMMKIFPTLKDYSRKIRREFDVFNYGIYTTNNSPRIEFLVT